MPISFAYPDKCWLVLQKYFAENVAWTKFSEAGDRALQGCLTFPRRHHGDTKHCVNEYPPTIDRDTAAVFVGNYYDTPVAYKVKFSATGLKHKWEVKRGGDIHTGEFLQFAPPVRRKGPKPAVDSHPVVVLPADPDVDRAGDVVAVSATITYDFDAPYFPSIHGMPGSAPVRRIPQLDVMAE